VGERIIKISQLIEEIKRGEAIDAYEKKYAVLESAYAPFGDETKEIVADTSLMTGMGDLSISIKLERHKLKDGGNEYGVLIFGRPGMPVYSTYFAPPLIVSNDRLSAVREDEVFAFVLKRLQDQKLQFKDANTLLPPGNS